MLIITNKLSIKDIADILGEKYDLITHLILFRKKREYKYVSFTLPKVKRYYTSRDVKMVEEALKAIRSNETDRKIVRSVIKYVKI